MDVLRRRADGWSFLTQLKNDAALKETPVITVSMLAGDGAPARSRADGTAIDTEVVIKRLNDLGLYGRATPVRILAIDDDSRTTELLAASLEPVGFEVLKASSGEEGLAMAEQHRPDLIILDLLMPGMNGFEVIEKLEGAHLAQQMPIILFTVKHLSAEERQQLKGRIAGVAEKGAFNKDAFVSIVGKVLQRAQKAKH